MLSSNSSSILAMRIGISINKSYRSLFSSMEKLSSGLKINRASDNPAGLVISEQLRAQIASLGQEIKNIDANMNKYATADAMVGVMREQLVNMRELAVGAANTAFNSPEAQIAYQRSGELLAESYNRQIENAEYNGSKLFDGSEGSVAAIDKMANIDFSTAATVEASIVEIDKAMAQLDTVQIEIGAKQKNEFEAMRASKMITRENLIAAESSLRDTDFASEFINMIKSSLQMKVGLALMAHSKINAQTVLNIFA
ncbi:MAG: flagellin [candidate division Zixibacteria bacterium]|nr:flagellin [candidate division Zixibacteria bacterium]